MTVTRPRRTKGARPGDDDTRDGLVVSHHGHISRVEDDRGKIHRCTVPRGMGQPICGDRVRWRVTGPGRCLLTAVAPRQNVLARPDPKGPPRPLAANLDRVYVVIAPLPTHQPALVDRYLVAVELLGLKAALLFNKVDLLAPPERDRMLDELALYRDLGYPLCTASTITAHGLDGLREEMREGTSILVGQSGVGKSSLVACLVPEAGPTVGAVSDATGHGRHTTSATTLYHLPGGGHVIDSPGVRDFGLWHLPPGDIAWGFVEFRPFIPKCQFRNCRHLDEPGCAVKAAARDGAVPLARMESYRAVMMGVTGDGR